MADFTIDEEGVLRGVTLAEEETAVELPSTVRAIGAKAFTSKHQCTKVTLNDECQEIREQAFYNNQTITELVIGADLSTIQQNAFAVNNPLHKIKIQGLNNNYTNISKGLEVVPFLLDYKTRNTVVLGANADEIVIPTGVTHIGAYAFANCKGIKKLTFATTKQWQLKDGEEVLVEEYHIKEIGDWAFSECIGIGTYAVGKNAADGMLTIPSTVETLGIGAFWGCSNVRTVDIKGGKDSGSLHYLPAYSFGGMERLTTLHIPLSVLGWDYQQYDPENYIFTYPDEYGINRTIGESTFQGSTNIEYVALENTPTDLIPDNVETDEEEWWDEKISPLITTLASFPVDASGKAVQVTLVYTINGIEYKNQYTSKCIQRPFPGIGIRFELLTLPTLKYDGLTFEGWYTDQNFKNPCNRPTEENPNWTYDPTFNTTLYAKLTSASNAFNYEVKTVTSEKGITSKYVVLVSVKDWEAAINENDKSLIIPETLEINGETLHVKSIGDGCCAGGKGFEKAEIPRYITGIGYSAFEGCEDLHTITFASGTDENGKEWKSSLTTIKGYAFTNSGLTEIALPDSVTSLYQGAFYNCPELETIILNENLKSIGSEKGTRYGTFDKCPKLQYVYVKGIKEWLDIDIGYSTCNPLYAGAMLKVQYKEEGSSVVEYREVTELNKDNLKGITEIPSFAFTGYMGLQKVDLTDTDIVTIGEEAFNNCQGMTELELRNGKITTLGRAAFSFCTGVEGVVIPSTLTTMGKHVFDQCLAMQILTIEEGVTKIAPYAYANNTNIHSVELPSTLTEIGASAFEGCSGLNEVIFQRPSTESTTRDSVSIPIRERAFFNTPNKKVVFPYSEYVQKLIFGAYNGVWDSSGGIKAMSSPDPETGEVKEEDFRLGSILTVSYTPEPYAFYKCSGIGTIALAEGIEILRENVFKDAETRGFYLPSTLTSVEDYSFPLTSDRLYVYVPTLEVWTSIPWTERSQPFINSGWLYTYTNVGGAYTLVENVTMNSSIVGAYTFRGCTTIKSVSFGELENVQIGSHGFENCVNLKTFYIHSPFTSKSAAFNGCSNISVIIRGQNLIINWVSNNFASENASPLYNGGVLDSLGYGYNYGNFDASSGLLYLYGNAASTGKAYLFAGASNILYAKLESAYIGNYTLCNCKNLKAAVVQSAHSEHGYHIFDGCPSLKRILLKEDIGTGLYTWGIGTECDIYFMSSLSTYTVGQSVSVNGGTAYLKKWAMDIDEFFNDANFPDSAGEEV